MLRSAAFHCTSSSHTAPLPPVPSRLAQQLLHSGHLNLLSPLLPASQARAACTNTAFQARRLLRSAPLSCAAVPLQVREGRVMNVTAREAGEMMKEGWVLLDCRPEEEVSRAKVGCCFQPLSVFASGLLIQWRWRAPR